MTEFNLNIVPERLLIKIVDTVTEKGIGTLFPLWHAQRKSRHEAISKADELRILAQAERDVEAIRKGDLTVASGSALRLMEAGSKIGQLASRVEPMIDTAKLAELAASIDLADRMRREINVTRALAHAARIAEGDTSEPSTGPVDPDWLHRWHEFAGSVSKDQLHELWGRVLTGEVKTPGTYSLRTLNFIKDLSTDEANLISRFSPFVGTDLQFVWVETTSLEKYGFPFKDAIALADLGIVSNINPAASKPLTFETGKITLFQFGSKKVIAVTPTADKDVKVALSVWSISKLGLEVLSLCAGTPNTEYLAAYAAKLKRDGLEAYVADAEAGEPGYTVLRPADD